MSIVGTRPPLIGEVSEYELHHRARLAIKPGITGMWQVSGRSDITDFEEVVELDKEYIENWNIETTDYVIGEVHKGDGVLAQGFPGSETEIEELLNYVEGTYGRILHNAKDKEVLLWQIEDTHVDSGNRVYELNGFSGSPVWSLEADEKTIVGLFTSGVGRSIYRGKVHALKMEAMKISAFLLFPRFIITQCCLS